MAKERVQIHCFCNKCENTYFAYKDEEIKCPECGSTDYKVIIE